MHRSDDAGHSWTEVTDGLPTDFGFVAAAHPHDRDSFYVIPLDPGTADDARRRGRRLANERRRLHAGGGSTAAFRSARPPRRSARGPRHRLAREPGLYFGTSTGQVFASADEGESWREIASYLPAISSVEVAAIDA